MKSVEDSASLFSSEDEKAIDKAVRRLPGYWTWDYDGEPRERRLSICPPWTTEPAFVIDNDGEDLVLDCYLADPHRGGDTHPVSGPYTDLAHLLRGIRAAVMGDDFDRTTPHATAESQPGDKRSTARGHKPANDSPYELTAAEHNTIESTLAAWEDAGSSPLYSECGMLFAHWDSRFPAFVIRRCCGNLILQDNLTVNGNLRIAGGYSTVEAALEAVRCIVTGDWDTRQPEVAAKVSTMRERICQQAA